MEGVKFENAESIRSALQTTRDRLLFFKKLMRSILDQVVLPNQLEAGGIPGRMLTVRVDILGVTNFWLILELAFGTRAIQLHVHMCSCDCDPKIWSTPTRRLKVALCASGHVFPGASSLSGDLRLPAVKAWIVKGSGFGWRARSCHSLRSTSGLV